MNKAVRTVGFIVAATFLSKVLGLFRDVFIAGVYGTTLEATAFLNASSIPILFFDLTLGAAILSSFIPVFNGYLQRGEREEAFDFSNSFINLIFLITLVFCLIGSLFPQVLVNIVSPGIEEGAKELTARLLIILLPTTVFTAVAFAFVGILQSFDEFNIPAIISLVSNLAVIIYLWLFNSRFGIYGLAVAMLIGWSLQVFIQVPSLIKKKYRYRLVLHIKSDGIRQVVRLSVPILMGSWIQPVTVLINKNYASYLNNGSAVSALDYANRFYIIIVGVFAFAITNYIFPSMSRFSEGGDTDSFVDVMKTSIRSVTLIITPILFGVMLLSREIVTIVYGRGQFDENSIALCSTALFFYAAGMLSYGVNEIINKCFYAVKKAYVPMLASVCGIAATCLFSTMFMKTTDFGIGGLALSAAIGLTVVTLVLCIMVNRYFKGFIGSSLIINFLKTVFCGFVMGAIGLLVRNMTACLGIYVCVAATVAVCAVTYLVMQLLFKNEELMSLFVRKTKE